MKKCLVLFLFAFLPSIVSAQVNLDSGLVAHLPFSGNANDVTGNGHNGTVFGASLSTDKDGNANSAYEFDGLNDYIEVPDHTQLDPDKGDEFAIAFWFQPYSNHPSSYKSQDIVGKWRSAHTDTGYSYAIRMNKPNHSVPNALTAGRFDKFSCVGVQKIESSGSAVNINQWHHVVYQFEGDSLAFYIDCNLIGKIADVSTCDITSPSSVMIGRRAKYYTPSLFPFYGKIDEVRFYDRYLTIDEVCMLYNEEEPEFQDTAYLISHHMPCKGLDSLRLYADSTFTSFRWEIGSALYYGKSILPLSANPGHNPIEITAYRADGTFKVFNEFFYYFRKGIADFILSDSVFCTYTTIDFIENCSIDDDNNAANNKLTWHFGEGTYLVRGHTNVQHMYTKPGIYNVSLLYYNGICDSTINKTIRIVESPKPGFEIDQQNLCAPSAVTIRDSIDPLASKSYYFSNINEWIEVSTNQFNHTFIEAGEYFIIQKIEGVNGCEPGNDTIFLKIKQGIDQTDVQHMVLGSYESNESIVLRWEAIAGVAKYQLYRSSGPNPEILITETTDTFYLDNIQRAGVFRYRIVALDSCSNQGASGRHAQPVFLEAIAAENNDHSILTFTPYEEWLDSNISYRIEYLDQGIWKDITDLNASGTYTDWDFSSPGGAQKCYRVVAYNGTYESYSNIVCLPYETNLFIPTAFSPNNDGLNDTFKLNTLGILELEAEIYDRWGGLMVRMGLGDTWDAEDVPNGAYLLIINYRDADLIMHHYSGMIHVVR